MCAERTKFFGPGKSRLTIYAMCQLQSSMYSIHTKLIFLSLQKACNPPIQLYLIKNRNVFPDLSTVFESFPSKVAHYYRNKKLNTKVLVPYYVQGSNGY
jgi:hypothetical protein